MKSCSENCLYKPEGSSLADVGSSGQRDKFSRREEKNEQLTGLISEYQIFSDFGILPYNYNLIRKVVQGDRALDQENVAVAWETLQFKQIKRRENLQSHC